MLLLLQFISLFAASGHRKQEVNTAKVTDSVAKSWLALGDSYTIGESVASSERYAAQTAALLKSQGIPASDLQYIARTGWTTLDLLDAISKTTLKPNYNIVSLLIGVNDQYQGLDTAGYRIHFTQLLQKAIQLAGDQITHVFVLSIPDYSVTPFGGGSVKIKNELDAFNSINKQVTLAYHICYIDITTASREAANDQSLTAKDGLHPSGKQYKQWALPLDAALLRVLK